MTFDDTPRHQNLPHPHPPGIWPTAPHYGPPGYQTGGFYQYPSPPVFPQQFPPPYGPHPYVPAVHVSVHGPGLPLKSSGLAVLLAFLFGPLGMLYSTVTGALVLFCVNMAIVFIGVLTLGVGFFLGFCTWIAGMVWAYSATEDYNRKLR
ncbi:hypothetical protein [Mycolicibacterium fortuitum]|uniref:Uncharacterized protein n=1 Tax=Mycolicibacterium fortuitum TaxID=1766 RepID=A0AAE4VDI5_MYCFO|nr:hypothetical protein [Mycolicibacterium fortuitum]MDV7193300.1 hypothetical protein [Mycolicibacterium fortuitum]MDV7206019.1 hypothetical protein [Mycolicibacterium fortuitum]MDV7227432.1 hypothetical protein [Mycolicibacterium fortuitum]MDV7259871.1 hypothetical protein [Mycolicibacterium fortuitum]MDV7286020.1 hypothetical protein [Mycolicibacterium fortuitum]